MTNKRTTVPKQRRATGNARNQTMNQARHNRVSWRRRVCSFVLPVLLCITAAPAAMARTMQPVSAQHCPWLNPKLSVARRVAMLMHRMTPADEIDLVEGQGIHKSYVFYMAGLPHLCVPSIGLEDGPAGVGDKLSGATALPAGVALAATWDPALAREYGAVIGAEQKAKGVAVELGPTINIDRDPRWGRSFESLSEDPYLTARLGAAEIQGIQSQGIMAQVKHFAVYNQETYRNTPADNVIVSQRALHEIYLPAFRAAIRRGKAASIMCSYATVDGIDSCQNRSLLTGVLREEWNFHGFVTSDYAAIHSMAAASAGTDMQQPMSSYFGQRLTHAVEDGSVPHAILDTMARHILTQLFRFDMLDHPPQGSLDAVVTSPAHDRLATRVAEAGTVLLKNHNHVLPLKSDAGGSIAVIGTAASASPVYAGSGSAYVIPSNPVSPLQGIKHVLGTARHAVYVQGLPTDHQLKSIPPANLSRPYHGTSQKGAYQAALTAPETGIYVLGFTNPCHCYAAANLSLDGRELLSNPGTPPTATYSTAVHLQKGKRYQIKLTGATSGLAWVTPSNLAPTIAKAVNAARHAATAIVVVGDNTESEAADRPRLTLPSAQNALIEAVAAANPHTIVVIDAGAPVAMPWLGAVAAVVDAWYPGQTNGTALAAILFGQADPGGHLPVTFPVRLDQVPAARPTRWPGVDGKVHYSEGIDVGYRWYDAKHISPLFPFGFGLSYTHFKFSGMKVESKPDNGGSPVVVTAQITNDGKVAGSDVAQLYLGFPTSAGEPPRKLVGFRRVELAPGQSKTLHFAISPRQTWWWHQTGWTASPGTYHLFLGDSSALTDLPLSALVAIRKTIGTRRVKIMAPPRFTAGQGEPVKVTLTAGGEATLHSVRLRLRAPPGWAVTPATVAPAIPAQPGTADHAVFMVTPPLWASNGYYTLYGLADLGRRACMKTSSSSLCGITTRDSGMTITLGGNR